MTVTLPRHEARRRALEVLYQADLRRGDPTAALQRVLADPHAEPLDAFAQRLIAGVTHHRDEIDAVIGRHAHGWSVRRMPVVDRNVLRLGVYELLYGDVPPAVAIDEAVELAKSLSTDESPRYVNGVLSAVLRDRNAPDGDQAAGPRAAGPPADRSAR